jgi:hypothetical protein
MPNERDTYLKKGFRCFEWVGDIFAFDVLFLAPRRGDSIGSPG